MKIDEDIFDYLVSDFKEILKDLMDLPMSAHPAKYPDSTVHVFGKLSGRFEGGCGYGVVCSMTGVIDTQAYVNRASALNFIKNTWRSSAVGFILEEEEYLKLCGRALSFVADYRCGHLLPSSWNKDAVRSLPGVPSY